MCVSLCYQKNNNMTQDRFNQLWKKGIAIESSFDAPMPDRNFQSFPEAVTGEHESGKFYGVHFSWSPISEFRADYTTCMFPLDVVGDIERRKGSHGNHVYLVVMYGDERFPVLEVENGNEYRTLAGLCDFRKVEI